MPLVQPLHLGCGESPGEDVHVLSQVRGFVRGDAEARICGQKDGQKPKSEPAPAPEPEPEPELEPEPEPEPEPSTSWPRTILDHPAQADLCRRLPVRSTCLRLVLLSAVSSENRLNKSPWTIIRSCFLSNEKIRRSTDARRNVRFQQRVGGLLSRTLSHLFQTSLYAVASMAYAAASIVLSDCFQLQSATEYQHIIQYFKFLCCCVSASADARSSPAANRPAGRFCAASRM